MFSIEPSPTFLIAPRPKRISCPFTTKSNRETFTSGGITGIPIRRHSAIAIATRSELPMSDESTAVMYSDV